MGYKQQRVWRSDRLGQQTGTSAWCLRTEEAREMEEQFVCQRCGESFPQNRMKEVFVWHERTRVREEVCPSCLDKALAEGRAQGIVGRSKKAAVQVTPGVDKGVRQPIK
jgi:DNA-directed RNA polymerase subunit RPC12/RpoP